VNSKNLITILLAIVLIGGCTVGPERHVANQIDKKSVPEINDTTQAILRDDAEAEFDATSETETRLVSHQESIELPVEKYDPHFLPMPDGVGTGQSTAILLTS
jgi:hypothetical protein